MRLVLDRDPVGNNRVFARRTNLHAVGRTLQQVGGRAERAVRGCAHRALLEADEFGRQPVLTVGPDLDQLAGHRLAMLVDEAAGEEACFLELDGDHGRF